MKLQDNIVKYLVEKNSSATYQELLDNAKNNSWANGKPVKDRGMKIQLSKLKKANKVVSDDKLWNWATTESNLSNATPIPEGWNWFKQ